MENDSVLVLFLYSVKPVINCTLTMHEYHVKTLPSVIVPATIILN